MTDSDDLPERERYRRGLPDYHDPLAGVGGAPPAQSALTLRLVLAIFGLIFTLGAAIILTAAGFGWLGIVFLVIALTAAIDIVVISRRLRRGEPG
jgi:Family of unknown function (DUF6343)